MRKLTVYHSGMPESATELARLTAVKAEVLDETTLAIDRKLGWTTKEFETAEKLNEYVTNCVWLSERREV